MQFAGIHGQRDLKNKLINSVKENRVSHAQLFYGPEGSGKLALAIAYAQYISCLEKKEFDSCGVCSSCVKYNKLVHPDLHFFFPNATVKKIQKPMSKHFAAEWREYLLKRNYYVALEDWYDHLGIENKQAIINVHDCNEINRILSLKSFESVYKIIIIYMVEKLFHSAAPKLLKILEEPPENTLFILISENQDQILNTIQSRTQLIKIPKHSDDDICVALCKYHNLDAAEALKVSKIANGNFCEALRSLEEDDEKFNFINFRDWMRACWAIQYPNIIKWVEDMSRANVGREKLKRFLLYTQKMTRACLLVNSNNEQLIKMSTEEYEFVKKFAPFINDRNIEKIFQEFNLALNHIERHLNPKITLMDVSFKLMRLLKL